MKFFKQKKIVGDNKAIMSVVNGPFELAWQLRGLQNFLRDLYLNPSLIRKCLDITTWFEIEIGKDIIDAGADIRLAMITVGNNPSSCRLGIGENLFYLA
jgi:uroporphyrinogen-III decarboxylase